VLSPLTSPFSLRSGCMAGVCVCNMLVALLGHFSYHLAIVLLSLLGLFAGGYMVTNLVLMIECVESARSRLLIVSLNGWPLGMLAMALAAAGTRHWRVFHAVVAGAAAVICGLLVSGLESMPESDCTIQYAISLESARWLYHHGRLLHADRILARIANRNAREPSPIRKSCATTRNEQQQRRYGTCTRSPCERDRLQGIGISSRRPRFGHRCWLCSIASLRRASSHSVSISTCHSCRVRVS
jgi:hypothetical protein